jgi:2-succinyl-5-enolpyruvyl-6-hydroxy-3-cyclohexene-1-carboxylate synthase
LIVLSADRPPESLHVGANQTVDQVGIFGTRVRSSCSVGPAEAGLDLDGYWRSTISQAVARAEGHGHHPGPVHLNVAFREPTVPVTDDGRTIGEPYPHEISGRPEGRPWQEHVTAAPAGVDLEPPDNPNGVVLAGEGDYDRAHLSSAAERLGWPVLATALSGLRGDRVVTTYHHLFVSGALPGLHPGMVVSVGRIGPSDRIGALTGLDCPQVAIDRWGAWNDPRRQSTHLVEADPPLTLSRLAETVTAESDWLPRWLSADATMRAALDDGLGMGEEASGPGVARALSRSTWEALVVASSMPIRDVDAQLVRGGPILANRGASGIDGLVSTGLGVAAALPRTVVLAGDLSMLHDGNGLIADQLGDVVFVVVDNDGGGLFDLLPQATHAPDFDRLFVTPHGLDLVRLASDHGLAASPAGPVADLASEVDIRLDEGGAHALVVEVDRERDLKLRRSLDDVARSVVAELS